MRDRRRHRRRPQVGKRLRRLTENHKPRQKARLTLRRASACRKTSPQGSLARVPPRARGGIKLESVISEDLKLPPRGIAAAAYAKNVPPAHFLHAAASEMTLLMTDGVTISQEIEPCPSCNPLSEKAQRPFSTVSGPPHFEAGLFMRLGQVRGPFSSTPSSSTSRIRKRGRPLVSR